jgi:membrane-associated HD superfamily phosphohydrolase
VTGTAGLPVDITGGPTIDPTLNVKETLAAAVSRVDDMAELRAHYTERIAELRAEHLKEMTRVHAEHDRQIHEAEQENRDRIREIDVAAQETEVRRNMAALEALSRQIAQDKETLRAALDATAETLAKSTAEATGAQAVRIAALEKTSYEGAGKSGGATAMWGYVVAGITLAVLILGALGGIVALVVKFAK